MPPKKSVKKRSSNLGDVTLNDFANALVPKNRQKKSSNNVSNVVKKEVEKSWDSKDEEEFEGDFVATKNDDGSVSFVIQKSESKVVEKTCDGKDGWNYPFDIWFILSEYIAPEDVGTFAAICKTSYEVICTSRFWFGLYRRYYRSVKHMPEFLQPECLVRKYGLRANVVRALYYMYQPFMERIKPVTTFEEHPESLRKYECQLLWHTCNNRAYTYYFKMKRPNISVMTSFKEKSAQPDLLELLDDISVNPDEHCRILEVSCLYYNPVPPVLGLKLLSTSLTLSSAPKFRYHRLQLCFGTGINPSAKDTANVNVILDPVNNIKIFDWWHPFFPCSNNFNKLHNNFT